MKLALEFFKEELVSEEEVDQAYAKAVKALEELELRNMLRGEGDAVQLSQRRRKNPHSIFYLPHLYLRIRYGKRPEKGCRMPVRSWRCIVTGRDLLKFPPMIWWMSSIQVF